MDDYTGYSQVLKAETGAETVYYTRGFELISRRVGQDAHYYLFDGGMSVRALTDETGSVTDTLVFDTFGNEVARTGSSDSPYGFQGEERDATGLYYLRARYMDPSTGTFTSMDTYGGRLSDPMSLHKYLFANSNPVKYSDPSGHFSLAEFEMTEAIDEILMSSLNYGFAYIGLIQNSNTSANNGEKLAGYFAALGLGMLMPFAFAGIALLPFVTAILVLVLISECMLVGAIYATNNNHEITGILMGIIAGDAAGHAFGLVIQKIIQWMNRTNNMSNTGGASIGRNYSGSVYRNYDSNYPPYDFEFSQSRSHRYTDNGIPGVYFSSDAVTAEAEVLGSQSSGGTLGTTGSFYANSNLLDLTQESTRNYFGVTSRMITGNSYENTHVIGQWAYDNGYNGIVFPSAQTNGVNYVFFYPDCLGG